ncbi:MAG: VWA domain-containing protein [Dehalococcoidia bacterium]|nr:VWA domain-containing protein [Dehalococcoidia bacterium]
MLSYEYSRWDGSQFLDIDADDILAEISDDLMDSGDLRRALQKMMQRGMKDGPLMGLQDLMKRLQQRRQERLHQYNVGSTMDDIQKALEEILRTEQEGIQNKLDEGRQQAKDSMQGEQGDQGDGDQTGRQMGQQRSGSQPGREGKSSSSSDGLTPESLQSLLDYLEKRAQQKQEFLANLPKETGKALKDLSEYEFASPDAKRKYDELMDMLKQQIAESLFQNMQQGLSEMTPEQMQRMREMIQSLNQMLKDGLDGKPTNFQEFMNQFGDMFGPNPPETLEDLMDQMHSQMENMNNLMQSMSPEQRQQLQELMDNVLQDMGIENDLMELATYLNEIFPRERPHNYPFAGDEPVTLKEALRLMEEMGKMEELEKEIKGSMYKDDLEGIDPDKVRELLGNEEAENLEALKDLAKKLEDAGYMKRTGNKMELTPRALRKIGHKALRDIFARLKRDRFGNHDLERRGNLGEKTEQSKPYQFGDPFLLDLESTVMNAIERSGPGVPVRISADDFDVYQTETMTEAATVVLLDQSRSMGHTGRFLAAKKVAMALHNLIKTQFPRDNLYLIGFADYARELKPEWLPETTWSYYVSGTNMHHAFMLSRQLLSKHKGGTKQIILISDGEPTAHMEKGHAYFGYPPTYRTIQETLKEVQRCTRQGITINTFMLEHNYSLVQFVNQMAKINKGRVFYTSPDQLGEYILVDYLSNKKQRIH